MEESILNGKLKLWQNRLLDLSKRNRMISFKDSSAQVIRFVDPDFETLYKKIVEQGKTVQIKRSIDASSDPTVYAITRLMHHMSHSINVGKGEIRTTGSLEQSMRTVRNIKKYADLSLQEKGTNILYISFGFIYWRDRDMRGDWYKAPLFLVPATLVQNNINHPFQVQKTEEDMIINPTFSYYMEANYGVKLPELNANSSYQDFHIYMGRVNSIIEKLGWRVEEEVYLSTMSFLKTNMYNDLVDNEQRILTHPIIRCFGGECPDEVILDENSLEFNHDQTKIEDIFEILNADSSQKDAIELSHRGVSFVMQGPPGTGKSQTITNIIAQAIGEGKTVLFVSEKQAALDVVYKRLVDVGVGDLCLPLHDPKTNKTVVLKQLEKNLDAKKTHVGNAKLAELHELASLKEALNAYAIALHEKQMPLDMSIYEAYEMLVSMQEIQPVFFPMSNVEKKSRADMNRMARECFEYAKVRDLLGNQWYTHPWIGVKGNNITNMQKQGLKELIEKLVDFLGDICLFAIDDKSNIGDVISVSNYEKYLQVARTIANFSVVPAEIVLANEEICETDYPEDIRKLIEKVQSVFGKNTLVDLLNINNLIDTSKRVGEAISGILKVLSKYSIVADTVGYFELLNLAEIMYQYGFTNAEINITDAYFDCSEDVLKLIRNRKEQIERISELREKILLVFSEQILNENYESIVVPKKNRLKKSIRELLKEEYSIEINEITDDETLVHWVENVLSGCFDAFGRLSENEFYYVYDLLEEANNRSKQLGTVQNQEAETWFNDYGSVLQQYLSIKDVNEIKWDSQLAIANDFYYIKSSMPGLYSLILLTDNQKQSIRENIGSHINKEERNLEYIIQKYGKASHNKCVAMYDCVCDYHNLLREIEINYLTDASILGGSYSMLSTDWNKIENLLSMLSMLRSIYSENVFLGVRVLLRNWNDLNVTEYMQNLQEISNCEVIPGCENHSLREQIDILDDLHGKLVDLRSRLMRWKEICFAANRIRAEIYDNSNLVIDSNWLKRMLEEDSKFLIDSFNILQRLGTEMESIKQFIEFFEDTKRLEELTITSLKSKMEACRKKFNDFDTLVEYQICSVACRNDEIEGFVEVAVKAGISLDYMKSAFIKTFLTVWVDYISQASAAVSSFMPQKQERIIETFKKLDQKQLGIAKDRVLESAFGRMPSRSAGKVVGEMGILLRELSKSRNALSIRQLFDKIPKLLLTLKPCLMMSPLSVAYFLKADLYCFDMVIFDEASQIFPENAIGAILRGKQVIISGDNKQMPPTAFFHTALGSQESESDIDEALNGDSILEEAENILPNLSLTWHYRSKNEGLITFSNRYMYSGSLVTFPNSNPDEKDYGVEYEYVEGAIYENRQNIDEANRCVELTIQHFIDHPDKSIGIIAFSISQEDAIEQAFNTYRRNHPEYEEYFRDNRPEPFFIKNLENVQGDERDTIILSIGYGLNRQGILRYNFGPLGMQGGERRMNVAITRAKYNIKLVCSLRPEDFDQAKVQEHAGAKLLYDYIRYAIYGVNNVSQIENSVGTDEIKKSICKLLIDEGFTVAYNIGNSGYKIPIAIEHPKKKGVYILGIETDGEEYVSARTARDREALRPDILKSMGWKLYRVWSTQWNRDIETEKKKLLDYVRQEVNCADEFNLD